MPQFQPDTVTFGDTAGLGFWDDNHAREHQQFVAALAGQSPVVLIPNFDFLQFLTAGQARGSIVQSHAQAHALLRSVTNVAGLDYSGFDLNNEDDFYSFLSFHSTEHQAIRQVLGIS